MTNNSFILNGMRWSYSALNTYETCPAAFKMIYIDGTKRSQNAFAEWGSLMHKILEQYYTGEIELFDLPEKYDEAYAEYVKHRFPFNRFANLNHTYKDSGRDYLAAFEDPFHKYEIIGVEHRFETKICGHPFIGVIDLILRDKNSGYFTICDHKSHKFKNKAEISDYLKQLYLYSEHIKEQFGEYPRQLVFNPLRGDDGPIHNAFDPAEYEKTLKWFDDTVKKIYADEHFACHPDKFYCDNLCSVNSFCRESRHYIGDDDAD